ncbi:MAG: secretion protein HlyD [Microcoleus sp. PH2017_10_PVI_O_A]|uniref:secretion protein HlyD n=1 Tax=unclassified Microcoleus TaxID=2642155 RepID=UPI001D8E4A88|nr:MULTISPECIES: secretion protein HlyD [unclassified Microcoleus]TAE85911.1 MAG: secretion protein HlyD [Oscillatoriales cyanobacterium]MCC3404096.1 secretion protein HlyD [Microcoleus sp. PH2017_10_PVI_O_A]MCC3458179.1 secretion protein HlyD [Microcoleus sp. PH2017_11_PCY_U_A]MCC3476601.1 secretion protein HlyD [Microcoleus sp. PH2017_12_PCY_D_A]MCC3527878.1 secretion protein HlyD [Microcoleus sp. PH2017_21_RUC_O_A]
MPDNQQNSLFSELTDRESEMVNGGSTTSGFSSDNSNSDTKNSSNGINTLFFVPQPSQLFLYDPIRDRPYKTLVV